MVNRQTLDSIAAKFGTRIDGLGDAAARLVLVAAAVPGAQIGTSTSEAYLDSAITTLAQRYGIEAPAPSPAERADAGEHGTVLRLDAEQVDARKLTPEQLGERSERARLAVRSDSEAMWSKTTVGVSRVDEGGLAALAQGISDRHRKAAGLRTAADAEAAHKAMCARAEGLWRNPTGASGDLAGVAVAQAEDLSKRLRGDGPPDAEGARLRAVRRGAEAWRAPTAGTTL
jgi:hypothetical protein